MLNRKGFTLIEILLVLVIIILLAGIVLVIASNVKRSARDSMRLDQMKHLVTALDMYLDDQAVYPRGDEEACEDWDTPEDGDFIHPLVELGYLADDLRDPLRDENCGNYRYRLYPAGSYGCEPSRGDFYVLGVVDLEKTTGPHPDSPGWSCPNRDWQSDFDWVIGKFEH